MPARTNDFQKLIYLLKHNLAEGATVTESKMLVDLVSGEQVEVDVVIEGSVAGDALKLCIECRDRSRRADKNWVHEMKAKHDRLPTNALTLASSRGFSKSAKTLAQTYGIRTVSLEEVENAHFPEILANEMSLWAKTFSVSAQRVKFVVEASDGLPEEQVRVIPEQHVFDSSSVFQITAAEIVRGLLNSDNLRNYFLREGRPEHAWFSVEWSAIHSPPIHLQKIEPKLLRRITKIIIEGPCSFTVNGLRLRRGKIGSTQVAWGKTVMFARETMLVATRDEHGVEKISISLAASSLSNRVPPLDKSPQGDEHKYRH